MSERPDEDAEHTAEGQDPAPAAAETPSDETRGRQLDDSEDEQVVLVGSEDEVDEVRGPHYQTQKLDSAACTSAELADTYDCLQIHTPLEELETYARARLETLVKLGEAERAQATSEALETGLNALRLVMGGAPQESDQ